ncbi:PREDICTED: uncharacterized protein LOC101298171 isoform X2 [Fragaria vesca subsp. vesca]|uniref:uncharacterized protein LOC101298171 isoform X2 n=1 Tax=Fragaria vesca subsp. vesca TaxID=101020 RepID=UPI0002C3590A|nr:PREDICTED: uncharacterized protein LOC101298171 isoform X2 [Fragaria vesca subsp. vesca]
MAVSAFRSSSRRSDPTGASTSSSAKRSTDIDSKPNPKPIRRSRSVSASSRTATLDSHNINKRDNPLFWSSSDSPAALHPKTPLLLKPDKDSPPATSFTAADSGRGRSVSRNADVLVGRSHSRVDTGRRNRSVSRCPEPRGRSVISKSEDEQECTSSLNKAEQGKKGGLVRTSSDELDQLRGLRTWSSQHSPFQPSHANFSSLQSSNWEDGVSTASSLSGAEEKSFKAACEQMNIDHGPSGDNLSVQAIHLEDDTTSSNIYETVRSEVRRAISEIQKDLESAMRRGSTPTLATSDISDIPPDLVNPSAVELVLDIRREYAKKLEQSKERARKLQSDLAVEEHRGQELSRILKEVLPDPKISNAPKSRPGRKASIERRKMSKRLTDEALAYFDECVSLSTFDSSDFSSPEDPPFNLVGITTPVDKSLSLLQESSSASVVKSSNGSLNEKQVLSIPNQFANAHNPSGLMASSGPGEPPLNQISPNSANRAKDWKFSFAHKPIETLELQQDIRKYIRHFEKDDMELQCVRSISCDLGEYSLQASARSYMFDRVLFGNRIESRGILLCGGGISSSFSPFSSFFG